MDLSTMSNFTLTTWPKNTISSGVYNNIEEKYENIYSILGISGNWIGDKHYGFPFVVVDSINEYGLSCGLQTLVGTSYEPILNPLKTDIFAGTFCLWATGSFQNIYQVQDALKKISIVGPDIIAQHFILHDSSGNGLIVEIINGKQNVYLDLNDNGITGYGIDFSYNNLCIYLTHYLSNLLSI
jgi:penicillin V acylase-like amidase (Ntn superfamily)